MKLALPKKPILLVPGFGGSKLVVNCPKRKKHIKTEGKIPKNDFINLSNVFTKQWEEMFNLKYDYETGIIVEDSIDAYDFGGVDGIRNLCEDCSKIDNVLSQVFKSELIINLYNYKYFDTIIKHLIDDHGYIAGVDLSGVPYDFRKIMVSSYLESIYAKLKDLIEEKKEITGRRSLIISHSLGGILIYLFLTTYVDTEWKHKYIEKFVSISAPYGGCSIALKTVLSGLPRLSFLKDKYYNIIKNSTGLIATLPNKYGYTKDDIIVMDKHKMKMYDIDDYLTLLPESTHFVWENNVKENIENFKKNTEVETVFVVCTDKPTDYQYLYNLELNPKTEKIDEPITTITKPGDTVVHAQSLLFHSMNGCMYDNYNLIEVPNVEHSKILDSHLLTRIISDCI
jgi:hypothetical protein